MIIKMYLFSHMISHHLSKEGNLCDVLFVLLVDKAPEKRDLRVRNYQ